MESKQNTSAARRIQITNAEAFEKAWQDYISGKTNLPELSSKYFALTECDTKPLPEFEFPEQFPQCCKWHKKIYEQALGKFNIFPGCCDNHKKLLTTAWFDKVNYTYMPMKVVTTITYTLHCVRSCVDNNEWFKEITDYIQYTIDSYGQFPAGFGPALGLIQYISSIEANIESMKEVSDVKKDKLIGFIQSRHNVNTAREPSDLNELVDIYKKWLRIFPFELSYLSHLEPHFQTMLPVLHGPLQTNIYSGITTSKLTSKIELLSFLNDITLYLLKEINAMEAFKKGLLGEAIETKIQLLTAKRKIEIESLNIGEANDREGYIKILKKWLKGEQKFVEDITPLLKASFSNEDFILSMVDGMKLLQSGDTNEECLMNIRNKGTDKESKIRYWFRTFLSARYKDSIVTAEEENGPGRMDLKLYHPQMGTKVIEFKGWWNQDKPGTPEQIINYLTDFEAEGFIFMVNHLKQKDIVSDYKKLVEYPATNYEIGSWLERKIPNSAISYYESKHRFTVKTKTIFHFLFNVHF